MSIQKMSMSKKATELSLFFVLFSLVFVNQRKEDSFVRTRRVLFLEKRISSRAPHRNVASTLPSSILPSLGIKGNR